ncbi:TetR/AcrR family transcriptional regulator [Corynebacterium sp. A21]|uniref:TetR/AcrR family transcriptional regulator n=1 Tax=Corynebacterium sp. A21 TaxID=3457318 RepID=UPI003FD4F412
MRPNKKQEILKAAVELIEEHGLEALTFEALAEVSGMSKSGLIYHFPSRHELLLGIHQHLAEVWEQELIEVAGGPAAEVDEVTRLRASVISLSENATRADLLVTLDSHTHPEFNEVWAAVNHRWMPPLEHIADDQTRRAAYLIQLVADGLWVHDHIHDLRLSTEQRRALVETVLAMIPLNG